MFKDVVTIIQLKHIKFPTSVGIKCTQSLNWLYLYLYLEANCLYLQSQLQSAKDKTYSV